jgi:hypothetical protein
VKKGSKDVRHIFRLDPMPSSATDMRKISRTSLPHQASRRPVSVDPISGPDGKGSSRFHSVEGVNEEIEKYLFNLIRHRPE